MEGKDVDNTIKLVEFCAGYGGIGIGLKRVFGERMRTIAYCELEGFCQANLLSKMEKGLLDAAPIWSDIKTFPNRDFHKMVDILAAGFPCQPFSLAGRREADSDERHLFPYIKRAAEEMRPKFIFLENVQGIISAELGGDGWSDKRGTPVLLHVLREMERVGYKCEAGIFSASEVGLPHQRKRVFILGYCRDYEFPTRWSFLWDGGNDCVPVARPNERQFLYEPPRVLENTKCIRGGRGNKNGEEISEGEVSKNQIERPSQLGNAKCSRLEYWGNNGAVGREERKAGRAAGEAESSLGRDINGTSNRMDLSRYTCIDNSELEEIRDWMSKGTKRIDELRMCGNGVVPQTASLAWITLFNKLMEDI